MSFSDSREPLADGLLAALQGWARLAAGLAFLTVIGACVLSGKKTGDSFMEIKVDKAWLDYDSVWVVLEDPGTGNPLDTVFRGRVESEADLKRVKVPDYHGEEVRVVVIGFKGGLPVARETRNFDGKQRKTTDKDSAFLPDSLDLLDTLLLYKGGEPETLKAFPKAKWEEWVLNWTSRDSKKASVSPDGEVTPNREGSVYIVASANDSVKDSTLVRIILDPPELDAGSPDTAVLVDTDVEFSVNVEQDYGYTEIFAWDLNGDGKYEDSITNSNRSLTSFTTKERNYVKTETITVRFYVRDGEGNAATASRRVKVSAGVPSIDSLPEDDSISVGDSLSFQARVSMAGGGLLKSYAWDFDGDGNVDDSGALSGKEGVIKTGRRYADTGSFKTTLRVTDAAGASVTGTFLVKVGPNPSEAHLASLEVSTGPLSPPFHRDSLAYRCFAYGGSRVAAVTALAATRLATVSIDSAKGILGGALARVDLYPGTNRVNVKVVSQDGSKSKLYTLSITLPPNSETGL